MIPRQSRFRQTPFSVRVRLIFSEIQLHTMKRIQVRIAMRPAVFTTLSIVGLLCASSTLRAQGPTGPRLDEILQRLEANLKDYDSGVPSFFCNEHVLSSQQSPGLRGQDKVIDSIFRLKRVPGPDHTASLVESRQIMKVDGKPAIEQQMNVPVLLEGAFEGGLAVVSSTQTACMDYDLQPRHKKNPGEPYIVRFATSLTPHNPADCLLEEKSKGRAFIDPMSMQITRLELTTPHHTIIPGDSYESAIVGVRVIDVDYAPVLLGKETFWMPSTIALRATSGGGTFHRQVWSFRAGYSNYHRVAGSSHIVSGSEAIVP